MKAYGITYEDFRTMAKYVSPDAVDYTDFNFSSDKSIQIMYPVDPVQTCENGSYRGCSYLRNEAFRQGVFTQTIKSNTYYTVIIDPEG